MMFIPVDCSQIQEACYEEDFVTAVEVAQADDVILVAILTKPIYLKSESDALVERLEGKISLLYPDYTILITRECQIYSKLRYANSIGDSKTVASIIKSVKDKRNY